MTGIGLAEQTGKPEPQLLRPRQVVSMSEEVSRIDQMLAQPSHVLVNVDVPAAIKRRNALRKQLDDLTPKPFDVAEKDRAVKVETELREEIVDRMCTSAEMRRNPAGAVDRHRKWESRKKGKILQWKNHRLRMHASGMLDLPEDATDVANIETLRPVGGSGELNMDNCQIPGAAIYLPPVVASQNHAGDEDRMRWELEENELLADFAAKGDDRAREALSRRVGEVNALAMLEPRLAAIQAAKANEGVPAERPAERTTRPKG